MKNLLEKFGGFLALLLMVGWFAIQTFGGQAGTALFGNSTPVRLLAGHTLAALFLWVTIRAVLSCSEKAGCPRRSKSEPLCRSSIEPGLVADQRVVSCG